MKNDRLLRPGWIKFAILAGLAVSGLAGGLYFSDGLNTRGDVHPPGGANELSSKNLPNTGSARFPLSTFDARDQMEAPELTANADGRVFLAWASQTGASERTLFIASSDDAGLTFSAPREIKRSGIFESVAKMKGRTVKRAIRMMPHVVARGNTLHLAWTEALPGNSSVQSVVVSSADGGVTFGTPVLVHRGMNARTTFTAFSAGTDDSLIYSWLDNRDRVQQAYASVRRPGKATFDEEIVVHSGEKDRGVCPCCPTANVMAADGTIYVAFRNITDGHRDIAIGVLKPGSTTFDGPIAVMPPTWKFNGCPHDGPSMAIVDDMLHVVWMDARTGSQRCYHAIAKRTDMKFTSSELHPISVGTQGNARLHVDVAGRLHAVWEESTTAPPASEPGKHQHEPPAPKLGTGGRAIQHAILNSGGKFGDPRPLAAKAGAFQTRPTITSTPTGAIVVGWNELDESGKAIIVRAIPTAEFVARENRP